MTTCEYIDSILQSRNMSRRKLALEAGIAPSSFQSAMERNKELSLDMLFPISKVLDISIQLLMSGGESDKLMALDVGEKIRAIRKSKNLTQTDVAQKAHIAVNSLRLYEVGKRTPNLDQLKSIAQAMGCSLFELFDEKWPNLEYQEYSFSEVEQRLVSNFGKLNEEGQLRAVERVEELTEIPRYQRKEDEL